MEEESKNLLPTVDVPDFVDEEEDEEYDVDYKPSPMWDLEKGDFVRTAANNVPSPNASEIVIYRSNAYPIIPKIHSTPQVTNMVCKNGIYRKIFLPGIFG